MLIQDYVENNDTIYTLLFAGVMILIVCISTYITLNSGEEKTKRRKERMEREFYNKSGKYN